MPRDPDKPKKYEVQLLASPGGTIDTNPVIKRYDHDIASSLLADFIFLGSESRGSYALAKEGRTFFEKALLGYLDMICEVINVQAVPELFAFNGIERPDLPKLTYEFPPDPRIENVSKLLDAMAKGGAELFPDEKLENALRAMGGLPFKDQGEE